MARYAIVRLERLQCISQVYSNPPPKYSNPPLPSTPTPLSQVLQPRSPKYSNPPLPSTPTALSQVLQPPFPMWLESYNMAREATVWL